MKNISVLIAAAAIISVANAQTLSLKGSDTLGAKLVPQLAEGFKAAGNKGVKFEIAAEGSTTAFPGPGQRHRPDRHVVAQGQG